MSCPRCGGMSAAELAAAMNKLVCEKAVIEGPYCHCDEIKTSMQACPLREERNNSTELPDDSATSEKEKTMIGYGKRVLLIHAPETTQLSLVTILEQEGFVIVQAHGGVQALCEIRFRHFDAVVIDYHIPDLNGLDLLRQSRTTWPEIPIILFSEDDCDTCGMTKTLGAFAWIRKSAELGILLSMLGLAMNQRVERESVLP